MTRTPFECIETPILIVVEDGRDNGAGVRLLIADPADHEWLIVTLDDLAAALAKSGTATLIRKPTDDAEQ